MSNASTQVSTYGRLCKSLFYLKTMSNVVLSWYVLTKVRVTVLYVDTFRIIRRKYFGKVLSNSTDEGFK